MQHHRNAWLKLPLVAAVQAQSSVQVHSILNRFALVGAALRMAIEAKPPDYCSARLSKFALFSPRTSTAASSICASTMTGSLITPTRPMPPSGIRWAT